MGGLTGGRPGHGCFAGCGTAGLLVLLAAAPALAQTGGDDRGTAIWDATATRIEARIGDPDITTAELEALREQLVGQRAQALAAEQKLTPPIDELNNRLKSLGAPPAEGITEAPEIADRRKALTQQIADAQAPLLEAQESYQRSDALIAEIDRIVRRRFSAELLTRGPSPLLPGTWVAGIRELGGKLVAYRETLATRFEEPVNRRIALQRLPAKLILLAAGVLVAFTLRRWLSGWVERRLLPTANRRAVAWVVALRNLTRLVLPAVGAGLFFAAFDPDGLVARTGQGRFFELPGFVIALIAAGWLSFSLFAPRLEAHRLAPLDNAEARAANRLVLGLGGVIALALIAYGAAARSDLSQAAQTVIYFPLILLGAAGLWRAARRHRHDPAAAGLALVGLAADSPTVVIGLRFLQILVRIVRALVIAAPLLAMFGYLPAAGYLVFPSILTLGLIGAAIVVNDLLTKTAVTFLAAPSAQPGDDGLIPVVIATLVGLGSLPLLALIWGARSSDLSNLWTLLSTGVTFGGIRISASVILTLIAVFALGIGLTRLLQTILRGSVLPRTRLDAGGRNAVLAGFGYVGFTLAALAAVSAAGLDLSNLAIVAGALSVGIGFGLQNVVSNFVSGIILLVERPVKEGDWIEVGGFSGYVRGIRVRSTEIETFDRAVVILPNSDLVAGTVLNRTHTGMTGRVQVPVGVSYDRRSAPGRGGAAVDRRGAPAGAGGPGAAGAVPGVRRQHDGLRDPLLAARRQFLAVGALGHELRHRPALPRRGDRDSGPAAARERTGRPGRLARRVGRDHTGRERNLTAQPDLAI